MAAKKPKALKPTPTPNPDWEERYHFEKWYLGASAPRQRAFANLDDTALASKADSLQQMLDELKRREAWDRLKSNLWEVWKYRAKYHGS